MKVYNYFLLNADDEEIDRTQIDEQSEALAREIFEDTHGDISEFKIDFEEVEEGE